MTTSLSKLPVQKILENSQQLTQQAETLQQNFQEIKRKVLGSVNTNFSQRNASPNRSNNTILKTDDSCLNSTSKSCKNQLEKQKEYQLHHKSHPQGADIPFAKRGRKSQIGLR